MSKSNDPKVKEVELKVRVSDVQALRARLSNTGWTREPSEEQEDIYYTSRHRDFIETEECLRLRQVGDYQELTWKPPTTGAMRKEGQFWKQEIDINVTGQSEKVRELLQKLDFVEYVTVRKHREVFRVDAETMVVLDRVDGIGWFLEIETASASPVKATQKNLDTLAVLDLDVEAPVNTPYRDLVAKVSPARTHSS